MAAVFCRAVEKYRSALLELLLVEKKRQNESKVCTWSYVSKKLIALLQRYPTGLTEAVILSELMAGLHQSSKVKGVIGSKASNERECNRVISVSEINETKQVELSCYLECYIYPSDKENPAGTKVVKLIDKTYRGNNLDEKAPTIEMYLHQKASCIEQVLCKYNFRMTNLRIHKVEKHRVYRLLPTEYIMPLLDLTIDKNFINEKFGTLEGILEEDSFPHYTRNVFVTIKKMSPIETMHNPYGDSIKKIMIGLVDSNGIQIDLILWDEAIAFKRLISVGDSLGIEDPFLVKDEGNVHLEYGPATVFFAIPAEIDSEIVLSQAQSTAVASVRRTVDGKLDFDMYPYKYVSSDVMKNCININFAGVVQDVSQKDLFHSNGIEGHKFEVEVLDDYGVLKVHVYDSEMTLHEKLHVGQMLLIENIHTDESSHCILETFQSGKLSLISALKGFVASPCLYTLSNENQLTENGNYFICGEIHGFQPTSGAFVTRNHLACSGVVERSNEGQVFCPSCASCNLLEIDSTEHPAMKKSLSCWKWRYSLMISVRLKETCTLVEFEATDHVCEELIELSAREFSKGEESVRNSLLRAGMGKTCVFSVTKFGPLKRIDAFEIATESFLENFKMS